MKQKKWVTYGLGLLVIGVWGIILQRIFSATDPGKEKGASDQSLVETKKAKVPLLQPDTFSLQLNYRDPFYADGAEGTLKSGFDALDVPIALSVLKPPVVVLNPLDEVIYIGHILNPQTKKRVAILSIAGKEHMVQEGENINKLKLLNVAPEEITMGYEGKIKRIKSRL